MCLQLRAGWFHQRLASASGSSCLWSCAYAVQSIMCLISSFSLSTGGRKGRHTRGVLARRVKRRALKMAVDDVWMLQHATQVGGCQRGECTGHGVNVQCGGEALRM